MELSQTIKMRASARGWSNELIARIEGSVARSAQIEALLNITIDPERIGKWLDWVEADPDHPYATGAQFVMFQPGGERGLRPTPSPDGMRLSDVDIGSYGNVPDSWDLENDTPRGTRPAPGLHMPGLYTIFNRNEVWAEGVSDLYEDAIRDRWVPATDLDWAGLPELSPDVERATGQICAVYSTYGIAEQKIISRWLESISYGFHEVKLFLATQVYDAGRKVEALRKRALIGSGVIGKAPLGDITSAWYSALTYTDMMVALNVVYKSYEVTAFDMAGEWARTDFDRDLFSRLAADSHRHLEYGLKHLEWYLRYSNRGHEHVNIFLAKAEGGLAAELLLSNVEREALAVLFADGVERIDAGVEALGKLRAQQYRDYVTRLHEAGFERHGEAVGILPLAGQDPLLKTLNPDLIAESAGDNV